MNLQKSFRGHLQNFLIPKEVLRGRKNAMVFPGTHARSFSKWSSSPYFDPSHFTVSEGDSRLPLRLASKILDRPWEFHAELPCRFKGPIGVPQQFAAN